MKNTTKLEKVKKFLDENGIKWHEPKKRRKGKEGILTLFCPTSGFTSRFQAMTTRCSSRSIKTETGTPFLLGMAKPRNSCSKKCKTLS